MTKKHCKSRKPHKPRQPQRPSQKNTFHLPNHNPLIAHHHLDTLVNVTVVLQLLHDCDFLDIQRTGFYHKSANDGLHLLFQTVLAALQFEINRQHL